ncbi:hypothetical protein J6590_056934 [Homalodisca vitripennis]|nr:hypothetical protein J6590_056934 [Homalodisca vitripennis]
MVKKADDVSAQSKSGLVTSPQLSVTFAQFVAAENSGGFHGYGNAAQERLIKWNFHKRKVSPGGTGRGHSSPIIKLALCATHYARLFAF